MKDAIKVLIVDDSALVRQTMLDILCEIEGFDTRTASNALIAERKIKEEKPDIIVLDIEMPQMDGLTFLKRLMGSTPIPVVICSSVTEKGSSKAMDALDSGAIEIIEKPKIGTKKFLEESRTLLVDTVRAAISVKVKAKKALSKSLPQTPLTVQPKLTADAMLHLGKNNLTSKTDTIIVVGASTGGTEALEAFLMEIPTDIPPICIVQHMPEHFTKAFADRLNRTCPAQIMEAVNGQPLQRGLVLIAPGGRHMLLKRRGNHYFVDVKEGPLVCRHRPSVDVLFRSAAKYAGSNAIGVIMTGMGDDGSQGMLEMKQNGSYNIAQDEASCVVYGMPKEAVKKNAVDVELPLNKIAAKVIEMSMVRK